MSSYLGETISSFLAYFSICCCSLFPFLDSLLDCAKQSLFLQISGAQTGEKKSYPGKKSKSFLFQLRISSSECRDAKFSFLHPLKIWLHVNGDIDFNARFITLPLLVLNKKPFLLHPVKAQDFPSSRI